MTRLTTLLAILALAAPAGAASHEASEAAPAGSAAERGASEGRPESGREAEPEGAAEPAPEPAPEPGPAPEVVRALFTTGVEEREPEGRVEALDSDTRKVFFFTELGGFQGQEVVHRWSYRGEAMAEVPFRVEGPRWRVYSSKELLPGWTGEWTVSVVDGAGDVVAEESFVYREAEKAPAAAREAGGAVEPARDAPEEPAPEAPAPEAPSPEAGPQGG